MPCVVFEVLKVMLPTSRRPENMKKMPAMICAGSTSARDARPSVSMGRRAMKMDVAMLMTVKMTETLIKSIGCCFDMR